MVFNDDIPWNEKKDNVYYHNALTGISYGLDGEFINRVNLLHLQLNILIIFNTGLVTPWIGLNGRYYRRIFV